jgi:hypothetical protein
MKRVTIKNTPTIHNTYSQDNYQRANIKQLKRNMEEGKLAVSIGKVKAYSEKRNVKVNNISEIPFMSGLNRKIFKNEYNKRKRNMTKKRAELLKNAEFKQLMRNINLERKNGGMTRRSKKFD